MNDIYDKVVEAYKNALENDYNINSWSASDIAEDLQECCSDLEYEKLIDIKECIVRYRGF